MPNSAHNTETAALLALLRAPGARWQQIADAVEEAGSALHVLHHRPEGEQTTLFDQPAPGVDLAPFAAELEAWAAEGIRVHTLLDSSYPENLRTVYDRPPLVFIAGAILPRDSQSVAVVGTRSATEDGERRAQRVARHLVDSGYTVVSGLAVGVDTTAHVTALDASGRTLAVIGTGLHRAYPAENAALQAQIARKGAVISQFLPDAPPTKRSFPMRNAVMSGLALATVVVEAGQTSGARMQARLALQHNRPVFLLRSLLEHDWAQTMQQRPGVHVIDDPEEVTETLQRLTAPALLTA